MLATLTDAPFDHKGWLEYRCHSFPIWEAAGFSRDAGAFQNANLDILQSLGPIEMIGCRSCPVASNLGGHFEPGWKI